MSLALLHTSLSYGATPRFIDGKSDVPLMPELAGVAPDAQISFDTPAGLILIRTFQGTPEARKIHDFYTPTLQAMGWTVETPTHKDILVFTRGEERLVIIKNRDSVTFQLTPED